MKKGRELSLSHRQRIGQGVREANQRWPRAIEGFWPFWVQGPGRGLGFQVEAESPGRAEELLELWLQALGLPVEGILRLTIKPASYGYYKQDNLIMRNGNLCPSWELQPLALRVPGVRPLVPG